MRPTDLSRTYVGVADVIKFTLEEYEKQYSELDLIIFLEETYPFRDKTEITEMIESLLKQETIATTVRNERKGAWMKNENSLTPIIEQTFMPRDLKSNSINIAQIGYCTVLRPEYVRFGDILGPDVILYNIKKKINSIEVRNNSDMEDYLQLLEGMKIYKVGILGCNRVAEHYKFLLTEYKEIDALDIVACCDLQENFASSLAKSFSGNAYTDLDFMLNNEELDFVLVLTPSGLH